MAFSLNRAQLIGNVTRDPEVRQTPNGKSVATFSVATNFSWTNATGQKQDKAEFHNIVVWGKLAEIAQQYLKKGIKIYVEGRIQTRDWEGEDGVRRYRTEIIAENFIMLGGRQGATEFNQSRPATGLNSSPSIDAEMSMPMEEEDITVEDLPF